MSNILDVKNLSITVKGSGEAIVDDVSFEVPKESIVALVGGSGSGKTTTGLSILRLTANALAVEQGSIHYSDENLLEVSKKAIQQLRGKDIAMIFQDPLDAFNPVFTIEYQIEETLKLHTDLSKQERKARVYELLDMVGIKDVERVASSYPHQLSGGMRQRAMIAQAISANPKLIIADEPTSNLDVTLQAKIMALFKELQDKLKLSILLISHDLGMVSHLASHIVVMSQGKIVEQGSAENITKNPQHEYTKRLMKSFS